MAALRHGTRQQCQIQGHENLLFTADSGRLRRARGDKCFPSQANQIPDQLKLRRDGNAHAESASTGVSAKLGHALIPAGLSLCRMRPKAGHATAEWPSSPALLPYAMGERSLFLAWCSASASPSPIAMGLGEERSWGEGFRRVTGFWTYPLVYADTLTSPRSSRPRTRRSRDGPHAPPAEQATKPLPGRGESAVPVNLDVPSQPCGPCVLINRDAG